MELSNVKRLLSFVSMIMFLLLCFALDAASNSTKEANALLKWKASLANQNPSLLTSWVLHPFNSTNTSNHLKANVSPCTWFGISCNHARSVVRINLTSSSLKECFEAAETAEHGVVSSPHFHHVNEEKGESKMPDLPSLDQFFDWDGVCKNAALSKEEWEEQRKLWPTSYHPAT